MKPFLDSGNRHSGITRGRAKSVCNRVKDRPTSPELNSGFQSKPFQDAPPPTEASICCGRANRPNDYAAYDTAVEVVTSSTAGGKGKGKGKGAKGSGPYVPIWLCFLMHHI